MKPIAHDHHHHGTIDVFPKPLTHKELNEALRPFRGLLTREELHEELEIFRETLTENLSRTGLLAANTNKRKTSAKNEFVPPNAVLEHIVTFEKADLSIDYSRRTTPGDEDLFEDLQSNSTEMEPVPDACLPSSSTEIEAWVPLSQPPALNVLRDAAADKDATPKSTAVSEPNPLAPRLKRRLSHKVERVDGSSKFTSKLKGFFAETQQGEQKEPATKSSFFGNTKVTQKELTEKEYDVRDYYSTSGLCSKIARHEAFGNVTVAVIAINAVYMGVDADHNNSVNLLEAEWPFQVFENAFCVFFCFEILTRFGAFQRKKSCLSDNWFRFDSFLVLLMVVESWILPFALSDLNLPLAPLRLLRLLRLSRMARLIRAFPELVTMIKGLRAATRAVLSTLLMLAFLVYIFAIIMNLLLKEKQEFVGVFDTIPNSMWTLLIDGTFLDNIGAITKKMQELEFMIASASTFVFMMFVLLAAMTVMNMLIGVLCEIVSMVARNEEEQQAVSLVKRTLLVMLQRLDEDLSGSVSFEELESLIEDHEALEVLESLEIDIKHLLQHFEMLYSEVTEVEIGVLMEMMLGFRGTRPVSVKDIIDITELLMFQVHQKFYELETSLKDSL